MNIAENATSSRRSSIAKSVAWNYAGAGFEALAGLFLVSYIVRRIAVGEYGVFLLAMSVSALLSLLDLGLSSLLVQAYVSAEKRERSVTDLLSTAFVALAAIGAVGVAVFVALAAMLPGPFNIPREYVGEASLVFVLVALAGQVSMPTIALDFAYQAFQRFDRLSHVQIATVTLRVVLTATLLAMGKGVVALATVQVVVSTVKMLLLFAGLKKYVPGARLDPRRFDWGVLRPLLKPGGWAVLDNCMRQMASSSDSFILGMFGSISGVALFGVGSKLPRQVWSLVSRGAIVMLPSLAEHHADEDVVRLRQLYLNAQRLVFTGVLPVVALGCVCARPLMQVWAGERYLGAAVIMQWLLFAALSLSMENSSDLLLYARGEVKTAARISTAESVANVLLSLVLVFRYGAVGLAVGTTLTHIFINALWYTPSACRSLGLRVSELLKAMLSGNGWAFALLAVEVVILELLRARVSAPAMVTLGVIAGFIYLAVWNARMVIPMRRMRVEAAD